MTPGTVVISWNERVWLDKSMLYRAGMLSAAQLLAPDASPSKIRTTPWDIFACDEATPEMRRAAWEVLLEPWLTQARQRRDIHLLRVAQDLGLEYAEIERRRDEPEIKRLRALAKHRNWCEGVSWPQPGGLSGRKPIAGFDPVLDSINHLFEYDGD